MATKQTLPEIVVGGARVKLTQQMYVAAGGEATIYKHQGRALRLYHDPAAMPPVARLNELSKITLGNVVRPIDVITDAKTGTALGFSMDFIPDTEPLCRFFTMAFKRANNISQVITGELVVAIQKTVDQLIREGFLPVDLNELNILPSLKDYTPYFIDIASWATPSFKATAIMDNVRDPMVKGDAFTPGSTWYSFGIIATQLYLGIHPFHGMHPVHKMDWKKRMALNASIFENGVKVPPVVPPFSVVPKEHLEWLKKLFSSSTFRDAPGLPGAVVPVPVTPAISRVINATGNFSVDRWLKLPYDAVEVYSNFGETYAVTTERVYWVVGDSLTPIFDRSKYRQVFITQLQAGEIVITAVGGGKVEYWHYKRTGGKVLIEEHPLTSGMFARNGRLYSCVGTQLLEHEFMSIGAKVLHTTSHIDNVNDLTAKFFDGVVYQDLFGKAWLTVPFQAGATVSKAVPQLDGYRVIDAKMVGHVCAVIGEKNGDYVQFIIAFDPTFNTYKVREVKDQRELNFTVTPNGICVMLVGQTLELFKDPSAAKVVDNPPIDASTKLFMTPAGVHFMDGTELQRLSVK
jgi:hypothetical protein